MTTTAFPAISKSTSLANGTTYAYVDIKPKGQKPCILFLHGFPSSSYDWRHQISFFADLGYGILAPDLLGYGGTDKPADVEAYRLKKMCEDVVSILDTEGIDQVVGVAHDWWGTPCLTAEPPLTVALQGIRPFIKTRQLFPRAVSCILLSERWLHTAAGGFQRRYYQ